ncbi:hypothetical protein HMPREF3091_13100 [Hafnia sp. HMSC23F03]|nr:hypothetical protein HMPREF3091_13100 [Hafnia sp. HMSC23F03]
MYESAVVPALKCKLIINQQKTYKTKTYTPTYFKLYDKTSAFLHSAKRWPQQGERKRLTHIQGEV